jgi:two-component system, NarL family, sensor kinase
VTLTTSSPSGAIDSVVAVRLAWILPGLVVVLNGLTLALGWGRPELPRWPAFGPSDLVWAVGTSAAASIGSLIAARRPRNPVGWLAGACILLIVVRRFAATYAYRALGAGGDLPGAAAADWVTAWAAVPVLVLLAFVFLLFPDGGLPPAVSLCQLSFSSTSSRSRSW